MEPKQQRWTVYYHTHTETGRRYVGLTKRTMLARWNQHVSLAKRSNGQRSHFAAAIKKYDKDAFTHGVIGIYETVEEANTVEERKIEEWQTRDPQSGFNIMRGGFHIPHKFDNPWERPEYIVAKKAPSAVHLNVGDKYGKLSVSSLVSTRSSTFVCDCGRTVKCTNKRVADGAVTSCGRCGVINVSADQRFGKLRIAVTGDVFPWSQKKVQWVCNCGRSCGRPAKFVLSGRSTSCGLCNLVPVAGLGEIRFGKLRMAFPRDFLPGSNDKVEWVCDCGKSAMIRICQVTAGRAHSCGKCTIISAEQLQLMKFGKLRIKHPQDLKPKSSKKVWWVCDCGRESFTIPRLVFGGNTISCGRCNVLSKEAMSEKFGKLRMKEPMETLPSSTRVVEWACDCGNEVHAPIYYVTSGQKKTCGSCTVLGFEYWVSTKFGKLKMAVPQPMKPKSHKVVEWRCDCGGFTCRAVQNVTMRPSQSCGAC